jgi:methyl-accepting chemotaxis protein PixJ
MVDQLNRTRSQSTPLSAEEAQGLSPRPKPPASRQKKPSKSWFSGLGTLGLEKKATLLAIALGTLPVLGIGGLAYTVADRTISEQISQAEQSRSVGLSDKLNRYMDDRFSDTQYLAKLPTFANGKIRSSLTRENKDSDLTNFVQSKTMYDSVAVFDLDGNVIAQSAGPALDNHRDRDYFQQVISSQSPLISPPQTAKSTGDKAIHIAAPIFDTDQKNLIGVVRTRIPLGKIDDVARNFSGNGEHYHVADRNGNLFLASDANEKDDIGKNIADIFPALKQSITDRKNNTLPGLDEGKLYMLSYAAFPQLGDINLLWNTVITLDDNVAFGAQRSLLTTILLGTLASALGTGILAAWLAKRGTRPILDATRAVKALGEGKLQTRLEIEGQDELAMLGGNINQMAGQLETLVKIQTLSTDRSNSMARIVGNLRRNLDPDAILQNGVEEVRGFLKCDRVVIYRFNPDFKSGYVTSESLGDNWISAKGQLIEDPLGPDDIERYKNGRVWTLNDIAKRELTDCHCQILQKLQVQANIVAPIRRNDELIGLICAHQCSGPREWDEEEIDLFRQLSVQIGYALDQSYLFEQTETARGSAQKLSEEQRSQKEELQMQLLDLLSDVESASDGNLTVRADVSAGEIGIVADFFNSIIENLRTIVTQVKTSAAQVNSSIGKNEAAIGQLATDAMQQANETTRTLDSLELMTQSILNVASNAQTAAAVTRNAADQAQQGGEAMDATVLNITALRDTIGETSKKVKRLGEASQEISKVVSLINQIAMQTNLLAINAGIEAARAGEEAQGFAVVAEEVAELATRSAAATREIEQIVSNIQQETSEVVNAMEQGTTQVVKSSQMASSAKLSLRQVVDGSRQVDELVQAISNATVSQVDTSAQISQLMKAIALISTRTSESSKQISTTLRETVSVAQDLQASVGTFTVN